VTVSNKSFRIVGYLSYESGLSTAGTYASVPTKVQLFGPGIKKPGDVVQTVYATTTTPTSVNNTAKTATALAASITPTSSINLIRVTHHGQANGPATTSVSFISQIYRNTGTTALGNVSLINSVNGVNSGGTLSNFALDAPATTSSTQYGIYVTAVANPSSATYTYLGTNSGVPTNEGVLIIEEIQG
jgi:hypothetical protein